MLKVLVVDDSSVDRVLINNMLQEYSVLNASDGIEAMEIINAQQDIDLVILDLNMPRMDGFQVLGELKSDQKYSGIRTIILTNYDEIENEIKGLKLGAIDYIRKPINIESLKARIEVHAELLRIQRLFEKKLHDQSITFDTIFLQAPIGIAISYSYPKSGGTHEEYVVVNPAFKDITGRTEAEMTDLGWIEYTDPEDAEQEKQLYSDLMKHKIKSYAMDKRYIKPDGTKIWVHVVVAPLILSEVHNNNYVCLIQNINKRKEAEEALKESERSKSVLLSHLPGLAYRCKYDKDWTMQYVSEGCLELTGYEPQSLLHNRDISFNDIILPKYRDILWEGWERMLSERESMNYEYEIMTAKGEIKWVLEMGEGVYNEDGEVIALEGIIFDITARKRFEEELLYNSDHDNWTGLYNQRYLVNLISQDADSLGQNLRALLLINLREVHFLSIAYGFHYSQELIKSAVERLNTFCSESRQLFHAYENQLVFYIRDYKDKRELEDFSETLANSLDSLLGIERIGGGIGIVEINDKNKYDADLLFKNLLVASENAIKENKKEFWYCFFDKKLEEMILREEDIKRALGRVASGEDTESLYLQYQPILDLKSNKVSGFEALARLKTPKLGFVPPLDFIPIAEETKLIIPIGDLIIIKAIRFLKELKEKGYEDLTIAINVSAIQLLRSSFLPNLYGFIKKMEVDPTKIILEITESVFASDYAEINELLDKLKNTGISVAIDDFGTGYSSLARERELNVSILKVDRFFIDKLMELKVEEAITGDIISMAHKLGHIVVAEGVEYEKQLQYLKALDCDKVQGYYISRPLDEDKVIKFLKGIN